MTTTLHERFWNKVHVVNDWDSCWDWTAAKLPKGYGRFSIGNEVRLAHRVAYELEVGPIPDGHHVDHACHNPACVRPSHLRAVTPKQNIENRGGRNRNNSSGVRGVSRRGQKFRATVKHNGANVFDREFDSLHEAERAVIAARLSVFTHSDADRITA